MDCLLFAVVVDIV